MNVPIAQLFTWRIVTIAIRQLNFLIWNKFPQFSEPGTGNQSMARHLILFFAEQDQEIDKAREWCQQNTERKTYPERSCSIALAFDRNKKSQQKGKNNVKHNIGKGDHEYTTHKTGGTAR
jgi:hypothetical protein